VADASLCTLARSGYHSRFARSADDGLDKLQRNPRLLAPTRIVIMFQQDRPAPPLMV
jgi:hypothetical protein